MGNHHLKPNNGDVKRVWPRRAEIETFRDRDLWIERMLAADNEVISPGAKLVAVRIALHLNVGSGQCYPSVPTLMTGTGFGERHMSRMLAALERSGWLGVRRSGGRGHANSFHLMTPETLTQESGFTARNPDSGVRETLTQESPQQRSNSERGRGGAPRPATRGGTRTGVGKELVLAGAAVGFEDLRAAWPRPWADDEAADRRAFEQAQRHASVENILAGAVPWVAAMEARYLPALAKWLAVKGWEKPPPKKPKAKPRGNGKVDLFKLTLKQEAGYVEDDDGNLTRPDDGRLQ
jgi:hypothetical protein